MKTLNILNAFFKSLENFCRKDNFYLQSLSDSITLLKH